MLQETVVDQPFIDEMLKLKVTPKKGNLLELCEQSVVWFAEKMLGLDLAIWQVKFLHTLQESLEGRAHNITAGMTSRQIGKSTSVAIFALWVTVFNKKPATVYNNTNVVIISRDYGSAKDLLNNVRKLYRLGDRFMKHKYQDSEGVPLFGANVDGQYKGLFELLLSKDDPNNATTITFNAYNEDEHGEILLKGSKAGSSIVCLAPTASVLGRTFSVGIVDEAAHDDVPDKLWYDWLAPTGDSTNAMWVFISTPWQPVGFFFEHIDPHDELGSKDYVNRLSFSINALKEDPSPRARKQYESVMKKLKEQYESRGRFAEMQRGYYCEFVKGDDNFFDPDKVDACFTDSLQPLESYEGLCDIGVDFGGAGKSHTVVTISKLNDDGTIERIYHRSYEVDKDITLLEDIEELMTRFNIQRVVVDDCPAGWDRIKQMEMKYWDVTRFVFRKDKVSKYAAFKDKLYRGKVVSYTDQDLRIEMKALQNSKGSRQSVIQAAKGYTDDLIDSWLISAYNYLEDQTVRFKFFTRKGVFEK